MDLDFFLKNVLEQYYEILDDLVEITETDRFEYNDFFKNVKKNSIECQNIKRFIAYKEYILCEK